MIPSAQLFCWPQTEKHQRDYHSILTTSLSKEILGKFRKATIFKMKIFMTFLNSQTRRLGWDSMIRIGDSLKLINFIKVEQKMSLFRGSYFILYAISSLRYFNIKSHNMKTQKQPQNWNFQYLQTQPHTLTMTRPPPVLYSMLYTPPTFLMIAININPPEFAKEFQQTTGHPLICCPDLKSLEKQSQGLSNVTLICALEFALQIESLYGNLQGIQQILCLDSQQNQPIFYNNKNSKKLGRKFRRFLTSKEQLYCYLQQTRPDSYSPKCQTNFLSLRDEIWKSSILKNSIHCMLVQETNRKALTAEMVQLALLVARGRGDEIEEDVEEDVGKFVRDMEAGWLGVAGAVRWYTQESFLYDLVNRLLRTGRHPADIFCLQPFVKDLFAAVRFMYWNRPAEDRAFKCYRGGIINAKEVQYFTENIGCIIQNLGFLSTSKLRDKAEIFAQNVLFEIIVKDEPRDQEADFGYADISSLSMKKHEKEVLFNILNCFIVKCVTKIKLPKKKIICSFIKLEYGGMAKMMAMKDEELTSEQKAIKILGKYQGQNLMKNNSFWNMLENSEDVLSGSRQFAQKLRDVAIKEQDKNKASRFLGRIELRESNWSTAMEILKECEEKQQKIYEENSPHLSITYVYIGQAYIKSGKYEKAIEYFDKCEKIQKATYGEDSPELASTWHNKALAHTCLGHYKKAIEYTKKCYSLNYAKHGKYHPLVASALKKQALLHYELGQYKKSLEIYLIAEQILTTIFGRDFPGISDSLFEIGRCYAFMNELDKAEEYVARLEKMIGLEDIGLCNLKGIIYRKQGRYEQASTQFNKVLARIQQTCPESTQLQAQLHGNLANTHTMLQNYPTALIHYKSSLQLLTPAHPYIPPTLNNLANCHMTNQNFPEALACYLECQRLLVGSEGREGVGYFMLLETVWVGVAWGCWKLGEKERAREYLGKFQGVGVRGGLGRVRGTAMPDFLRQIYQICAKLYKEMGLEQKSLYYQQKLQGQPADPIPINSHNPPQVLYTQGEHFLLQKNFPKALEALQSCLPFYTENVHKENNRMIAACYQNLGDFGNFAVFFRKKCELLEALGEGDRDKEQESEDLAQNLGFLAAVFNNNGKPEEARPLIEKSLQIQLKQLGQDHPELIFTYKNAAAIYCSLKNYRKGVDYNKQCYRLMMKHFPEDKQKLQQIANRISIIQSLLVSQKTASPPQSSQSPKSPQSPNLSVLSANPQKFLNALPNRAALQQVYSGRLLNFMEIWLECLRINALRMLGRYEEADSRVEGVLERVQASQGGERDQLMGLVYQEVLQMNE